MAEEKLHNIANKIQDELAGGAKLEEVAKSYDLKILNIPGFYKNIKEFNGLNFEHIFILSKEGFEAEKDDEASTIETKDNNYMFFQLDSVYKPQLQGFDKVRESVIKKVSLDKKIIKSKNKVDEIISEISLEKGLNTYFDTKSYILERTKEKIEIPASLLKNVFNAKVGEGVFSKIEDGYVVAQVSEIIPADKSILKKNKPKFQIVSKNLMAEDVSAIWMNDLLKKYKVEENNSSINSVIETLSR